MVDTPFVSENFQRSYRNAFPSQVSSGRDLHVSDVIIPVVDFTPTTATTSLPFNLLTSINYNTIHTSINTGALTTITSDTGFFKITANLEANSGGFFQYYFNEGGTTTVVKTATCAPNQSIMATDFIFIKTGVSLQTLQGFGGGTGALSITLTSIADVNGKLTEPNGYDPQ